jgi:membrane dipeptidase
LVEGNPEHFLLATRSADVRRAKAEGKIAALIGIEGGYQIDDSLAVLRSFYRLGARYLTLTWLHSHSWADSSGSPFLPETDPTLTRRHGGLSDFGEDVLREMNRLGMLIDISHVSDEVVRDALAVSRAPLIASHSNARALSDIPRNLSDDLARDIAAAGGVLMVNFASEYMSRERLEAKLAWNVHVKQRTDELTAQFPNDEDNQRTLGMRRLRFSPDRPAGPLSLLVDHIDHLVQVAGIDHVGLGSDFDGGITPPVGLDDVSKLPNLTHALLQRGYDEVDIRKILGENFLRVFEQAERIALE